MNFGEIVPGTEIVGPLASHALAEQFWRRLSERHRWNAAMRFQHSQEKMITNGR